MSGRSFPRLTASRAGGNSPGSRSWTISGRSSEAESRLADLHVGRENVEPWPLRWVYSADTPLSYRVEKMRLNKNRSAVRANESLTLADIPPEASRYRLGNRSALEWVIDQHQVTTDKRSGITSDPNWPDDPEYIVHLVGRVVRVSVETVRIIDGLSEGG